MASEDRKTAREDARLDAEATRATLNSTHGSAERAEDVRAGWNDFRHSAS
jgi:hypothetical protein